MFVIAIITTVVTFSSFSMEQMAELAETVEIKQTTDFEKTKEDFEVVTIDNVNNKFNMTVTNRGENPITLTRLWVENTTDSTWPVSKYDLDVDVPSGSSVTNIGQSIDLAALDSQSYMMKLVTESGNTQRMFVNSDSGDSIHLLLSTTPTIVPTTFSTTVQLEVINTGTNRLINVQPEMDSVVTTCNISCSATLVSGPTPTKFDSLEPGDIALFEWVYTIDGEDTGDSVTFTASLVNGVGEDTASVSVQPIINAINANVALTSGGLEDDAAIDDSVLLFHMEQGGVPTPGYQMMSSDTDGGPEGLLFNMETQTVGSAVSFMTNNGSNTITIPAGNWNASLALRSEAVATLLQSVTNAEDMIFHFEDGVSGNPDNSEGSTARDLVNCGTVQEIENVGTGTDEDAEENNGGPPNGGDVEISSSDLELPHEAYEQIVGLRFINVNVPQGATITSASILFAADESDSSTNVDLDIFGQDADNPADFNACTNSCYDVSSRTKTTAKVDWNDIPAWSTGERGADTTTPDLSSIVQEIVNRGGWSDGNSMVFIIEDGLGGSGHRVADSSNGGTPAQLTITFGIGGTDGEPPTWEETAGPHGSGAYKFDGVNDCFASANPITPTDGNDPHNTDNTTSLWFKTDGVGLVSSEQYLVYWDGNGNCPSCDYYKISLGEDGTGKLLFEYNLDLGGTSTTTCRSVNEYDDGAWHHVVAVRDQDVDECALYITDVNGSNEETITGNDDNTDNNVDADGRWMVGGDKDGNGNFKGWIDDVMHWNDEELTSAEAEDLALTNYGTGAHQLNVNLDLTDENGAFVSNLYSGPTTLIPFQDAKGQSATTDSAYTMYNVTFAMPQTVLAPLQRLNYSMAFIPSTASWEALELDFKIDDTGFTSPYPSYIQFPTPDNPFPSYIQYDNDNEIELLINNVGLDGVFFVYSETRVSFDGDNGSYAALIHYINGTTAPYSLDYSKDSIYIPTGESAHMYFYAQPTDHPCQAAGSSCQNANIIPPGDYRVAAWVNGYSDQGETFGRSVVLGNVNVLE